MRLFRLQSNKIKSKQDLFIMENFALKNYFVKKFAYYLNFFYYLCAVFL